MPFLQPFASRAALQTQIKEMKVREHLFASEVVFVCCHERR
jgi:hypothetical protein